MTKARTLADFNSSGVLTSTSSLDPAKLDAAGTIPSALLAGVGGENTPAFTVKLSANHNVASGTALIAPFDSEQLDTDNAFDTTNYKFIPQTAGNYFITFTLYGLTETAANGNLRAMTAQILKNGSAVQSQVVQDYNDNFTRQGCVTTAVVVSLNGTSDYVTFSYDITANSGNGKIENHTRASGFKLAE